MIKKVFVSLIALSLIFLCGFTKKEKPFVILSSGTISKENVQRVERFFNVGSRINYALILPDSVKYSGVRMQISKQDDKTSNWGYSIIEANDIYIVKGEKIYRNYFVPRTTGHYIIQFFYLNKKNYPFVHKEFMVQ
ncbi:hypothetical protein II906_08885 [bacterium]|nr:hypothetical protein [bacterium]